MRAGTGRPLFAWRARGRGLPCRTPGQHEKDRWCNVQHIIELFQWLTLVKMGTAVLMVVLLSVLAEAVSPKFAGILSGYPLGAAIGLFFMGLEISPGFAAEGALYTSVGLIATQVFAYGYYRISVVAGSLRAGLNILLSSLAGTAGFLAAASILSLLPISRISAVLLPSASIVLFIFIFRHVKDVKIQKRVGMNPKVLFFRSAFAACSIVVITSTAGLVGPAWAGMFAAFPITMLPFVVIIHFTYGPGPVYSILKSVHKGLGSLVAYSLAVSFCYPACGIYGGTAVAYGLATLYLVATQVKFPLHARS